MTGTASVLGRRVSRLLGERSDVDEVVGLDLRSAPGTQNVDLLTGDLSTVFADADGVIHLSSVFGPAIEGPEIDDAVDVSIARRVFEAAAKAGVANLVVLSSATVYGPWANNAVPLTEEAPLRPHPDLAFAVQRGEIERLAWETRRDNPAMSVACLRPATLVLDGRGGWLASALDQAADIPTADDTAAQYLHVNDLATAVIAAWEHKVNEPLNVAPDGWLTPTQRRALDPVPRLRLPEPVALTLASWRWKLRLAPIPPGVLPYARHPWVVANDRLTKLGWEATFSNEEAYVAGHDASLLETISPQRRQELALGVSGAVVAGVVVGALAFVRRRRRRTAK